jgi:hypothetical protein
MLPPYNFNLTEHRPEELADIGVQPGCLLFDVNVFPHLAGLRLHDAPDVEAAIEIIADVVSVCFATVR